MDIYRNYYINIINGEQVEIVYSYLTYLTGWSYRYYCPIPGCGHHILSTLGNEQTTNKGNDNVDENDASNATKDDELKILSKGKSKSIHFPHVTALKQHYSKVLE